MRIQRIVVMYVICSVVTFFISAEMSDAKPSFHSYWKGFASSPIRATPIQNRPYAAWMVATTPHMDEHLYGEVSSRGEFIYWCKLKAHSKTGPNTICLINFTEPVLKERILLDKRREPRVIGYHAISGDWILLVTTHHEFTLLNLKTGKQLFVGKVQIGRVENEVGPFGTIYGNKVVWVDEYLDPLKRRRNAVMLFDIPTRKTKTLFEVPPDFEIDHVALEGERLVYSLVDLRKEYFQGIVDSDVHLYEIETGKHTQLSHTKEASQPEIAWPYIVWKTSLHFNSGGVYLYNAETQEGKELAKANLDSLPPFRYDFPRISPAGVTWKKLGDGPVPLYHPVTQTKEIMDPDGGLPSISGLYMTWVSGSKPTCPRPEKHSDCLFFSDLSKPNPQQESKK